MAEATLDPKRATPATMLVRATREMTLVSTTLVSTTLARNNAGPNDAGVQDAGVRDAGVFDAGVFDAGVEPEFPLLVGTCLVPEFNAPYFPSAFGFDDFIGAEDLFSPQNRLFDDVRNFGGASEFYVTTIFGDADAPTEMAIGTDRGTSPEFLGFGPQNDGRRRAYSVSVDGEPQSFTMNDNDGADFFSLYRACLIAKDPPPAPLLSMVQTRFCANLKPTGPGVASSAGQTLALTANVPAILGVRTDLDDLVELGFEAVMEVPVGTQLRNIDVRRPRPPGGGRYRRASGGRRPAVRRAIRRYAQH